MHRHQWGRLLAATNLQHLVDALLQLRLAHRLGEIGGEMRLARQPRMPGHGQRGQQHQRQPAMSGKPMNRFGQLDTVTIGHLHVENRQRIRSRIALQGLQQFIGGRQNRWLQAHPAQLDRQQLAIGGIVIHADHPLPAQLDRQRRPLTGSTDHTQRQFEPETCTLPGRTLDTDHTCHCFDQALADRQAEAGTAELACGGRIRLRKCGEQAWQHIGWNTDAGIAHLDPQQHLGLGLRHGIDANDDLAGRGEFDRVVDQIQQHLAQPAGIAQHPLRHRWLHQAHQFELLLPGFFGNDIQRFVECGAQIELDRLQFHLASLDLGKIQQIVDQRQQGFAGCTDRLGELQLRLALFRIQQQGGKADHRVERRADFVAHVRQEFRLGAAGRLGIGTRLLQQLFAAAALGKILDDPDTALGQIVAIDRLAHQAPPEQPAILVQQIQFVVDHLSARQDLADQPADFGMAFGIRIHDARRLPFQLRHRISQHFRQAGAYAHKITSLRQRQTYRCMLENQVMQRQTVCQRFFLAPHIVDIDTRAQHALRLAGRIGFDHTPGIAYPFPFTGTRQQAVVACVEFGFTAEMPLQRSFHQRNVVRMRKLLPGRNQRFDFPFRITEQIDRLLIAGNIAARHVPIPQTDATGTNGQLQPLLCRLQTVLDFLAFGDIEQQTVDHAIAIVQHRLAGIRLPPRNQIAEIQKASLELPHHTIARIVEQLQPAPPVVGIHQLHEFFVRIDFDVEHLADLGAHVTQHLAAVRMHHELVERARHAGYHLLETLLARLERIGRLPGIAQRLYAGAIQRPDHSRQQQRDDRADHQHPCRRAQIQGVEKSFACRNRDFPVAFADPQLQPFRQAQRHIARVGHTGHAKQMTTATSFDVVYRQRQLILAAVENIRHQPVHHQRCVGPAPQRVLPLLWCGVRLVQQIDRRHQHEAEAAFFLHQMHRLGQRGLARRHSRQGCMTTQSFGRNVKPERRQIGRQRLDQDDGELCAVMRIDLVNAVIGADMPFCPEQKGILLHWLDMANQADAQRAGKILDQAPLLQGGNEIGTLDLLRIAQHQRAHRIQAHFVAFEALVQLLHHAGGRLLETNLRAIEVLLLHPAFRQHTDRQADNGYQQRQPHRQSGFLLVQNPLRS